MSDLAERLLVALVAAVIGTVTGWAGTALTLSGRVDTLEKTTFRIETKQEDAGKKLDQVLSNQSHNTDRIIRESMK